MENYLYIDNEKIALSPELTKSLKKEIKQNTTQKIKLSEKAVGDTFKIGDYEFIVLEHDTSNHQIGACTLSILKDLWENGVRFGDTNNYAESSIRKLLKKFQSKLEELVEEESLISHLVDLTSDDGLKDCGEVIDKVSLLTAENIDGMFISLISIKWMGGGWQRHFLHRHMKVHRG